MDIYTIQKYVTKLIGYGGLVSIYLSSCICQQILIVCVMAAAGFLLKGSQDSVLYILFGIINKPKIVITGYAKPGYESVKKVFEKNFDIGMEQGSQLVVYVKNEKVVDLCGTYNTDNFDENTIMCVNSCTKVVSAIVVAMLVDRGYLEYEEKIAKYWPEFAKNGKQDIKLEDVLRHESGLLHTSLTLKPDMVSLEAIQKNAIGKMLEDSEQKWHPKTTRTYHLLSRDIILNEVVRRVDPKKRTIGVFLKEELCEPNNFEFYIGVPDNKMGKIKRLVDTCQVHKYWFILQGLVPKFLGRRIPYNIKEAKYVQGPQTKTIHSFFGVGMTQNDLSFIQGEIPSAGGHCNAKGMAAIINIMANRGSLNGKQIISEKTYEKMMSEPKVQADSILLYMTTKFTKGGMCIFDKDCQYYTEHDSEGFVGWQGLGGSYMQWQPEYQIGFGYAINLMERSSGNARGLKLRAEIIRTVKALENEKKKEK